MRFRDVVTCVRVFSQYQVKDSKNHNIVFFNSGGDALNQYTLSTDMCDSQWSGRYSTLPDNYRLAGVAIAGDELT